MAQFEYPHEPPEKDAVPASQKRSSRKRIRKGRKSVAEKPIEEIITELRATTDRSSRRIGELDAEMAALSVTLTEQDQMVEIQEIIAENRKALRDFQSTLDSALRNTYARLAEEISRVELELGEKIEALESIPISSTDIDSITIDAIKGLRVWAAKVASRCGIPL